ncbi:FAD/NAD(P)-binding domain-containing protein [Stemphylium lycopersici]|uniref:FAD/NAD(P)-binding domain-containing protein n=1 Tax=Stemphylium lycopersici TaxID=183478 RepID=A0A364N0X3_STELY|nr:FAD/NAD(P)-binding domain-containing protein [Stemphylium lycopersici]
MASAKPKNIVIVGGSLGGLLTGVAPKRLRKDLNIRIFERNPTPLLQDQGAGVVAGQDVQKFFETFDRTQTPLAIPSHQRLYLDKSGKVIGRHDQEQRMTSWDLLYHLLRANYDDTKTDYAQVPVDEEGEGKTSYEYGCTVTSVEAPKPMSAQLDFSNLVKVSVRRKSGDTFTTDTDLVIAADGPSSKIRGEYLPNVKREYAGYVAWRGTVPETEVSQAATDVFVEKFPFYHTGGIQILAYTIPGKNGTTKHGERLLNWVWYVNYKEESPEHVDLMTDKDGRRHHITLPPGGVKVEVWERQKQLAKDVLPPQFAELVNKTQIPFIQAITDVIAPSALLDGGRVLLLGDALAGFRPHTAASTNQAALDAMKLAVAVDQLLGGNMEALKSWEDEVMEYGKAMQSHGVQMGNRSQFGEHPMQG